MNLRKFNWQIWAGFLVALATFISYPFLLIDFPIASDFPWTALILFMVAAGLLFYGVRRAFGADRTHPKVSKVGAGILVTLSLIVIGLFVFTFFVMSRWLPASSGAPQVGSKAPDFTLADSAHKQVSLSELLSTPINGKAPKGLLLVFYRGYW